MLVIDIVAIALVAVFFLLGLGMGFGRGLKFLTGGIFGKIISVVVCYFLFGIVLSWGFVQDLLASFVNALTENGSGICEFLLTIRIEMIVFAIALFVIVQLLRILIVNIVQSVMEIDSVVMRVINKILGVALFLAALIVLALIVFQIIAWISGTEGGFYQSLQGSIFGLDSVFKNNPLNSVFETAWREITGALSVQKHV